MSPIQPYYEPGRHITARATADVAESTAVRVDADATAWAPEGLKTTAIPNVVPVETCPAGVRALGVANKAVDVSEDKDDLLTVYREGVVPALSGAAIAAGDEVEVGTGGKFIPLASGIAVGMALNGAGAGDVIFALAIYS